MRITGKNRSQFSGKIFINNLFSGVLDERGKQSRINSNRASLLAIQVLTANPRH